MKRDTAVAGYFYPDDKEQLIQFFNQYKYSGKKEDCYAVLVPHAGYIYSGRVAVETLSRVKLSDTVVILATNHTGFGESIAVWSAGAWSTPLGDVVVDDTLANKIINSSFAKADVVAHVRDHAIEVILPILKYLKPDIKVVPISVMGMNTSRLSSFASDLYSVIKDEKVTIIVSTDFNHYEDKETTDRKDLIAIEPILSVDPEELYDKVMDMGISMCGIYPAYAALSCVRQMGATKGTLIEHTTSAEASHDTSSVVGYAGILIK